MNRRWFLKLLGIGAAAGAAGVKLPEPEPDKYAGVRFVDEQPHFDYSNGSRMFFCDLDDIPITSFPIEISPHLAQTMLFDKAGRPLK